MTPPKNIRQSLREIERIFQATMKKIDSLHQEKMALIKHYYDLESKESLEKIRRHIKKD
ncbi:MAG: hypothetical protein WC456_02525 [Patescibacteria group bacterium]